MPDAPGQPIGHGAPVALVTGAAKRVGAATALALARAGCDVAITYRTSAKEAEALRANIESLGRAFRADPLDLDDPAATEAFGQRLAAELPRLDVLVHNASNYFPTPLAETTPDQALTLYRVNALSPLLLTKALAAKLATSDRPGGGSVVCMADIHALGRPRKGFAAYAMAKAALAEMVRSLARELAPAVRVNAVAPGVVEWPGEGYESDQVAQEAYLRRVPLARAGTPADAAEAVRWLALDAHYTTGQIVRVDGGRFLN